MKWNKRRRLDNMRKHDLVFIVDDEGVITVNSEIGKLRNYDFLY